MGYTPPTLYVNKVAGGWSLTPPDNTTTDDLFIYANTIDALAKIEIRGTTGVVLHGTYSTFSNGTTEYLSISYATPDVNIVPAVNKNIFLNATGTGVVKFGTYTAGAATDSTGYITILDAAGNTRKLMVQA